MASHIDLCEKEQKIRNLLVEYCHHYDSHLSKTKENEEPLVLRITGGWVRDKLLGLGSNDLDIAVNKLTGLEFAEGLKQYIADNSEKFGLEPRNVHKIEKNPEKSKHLETATTQLYGLDVDFVNLRSEEYAGDSRIPQMKFGTPSQDAYRRDATLNALFYNLQEQKVEDFTGKGMDDLKNGVLRTPLSPFETFHDDPLRVLRLIRFSATFGFKIAAEAIQAMQNPDIKLALIRKISRERVGVEVSKLLAGKYAFLGLQHIQGLKLEDAIFHLFDGYKPLSGFVYPESNLEAAISNVNLVLVNRPKLPTPMRNVMESSKSMSLLWLAAILSRWTGINAIEKNKEIPAVIIIVREGLKLPVNDGKLVARLHQVQPEVAHAAKHTKELSRKQLGVLIRKCGEHWPLALTYSLVNEGAKHLDRYINLVKAIETNSLQEAWALRPLVNGKEIQQAFEIKKGGPWLAKAVEMVIEYQLENPAASKSDCLDYITSQKDGLLAQN
ncbi:hypothetical protein TRICI_001694 [Trichomonascus ciferrii]|uniref:CCA tRNA nucleotidyltransferase, mitochondrial n=1 Tax=Trichomonascus ciferrii TaxID=44093 RepID=A0A642VC99_9ASCO|nr:hypothetical protein TRICI_001694 [Trichomonascus ciferrii]